MREIIITFTNQSAKSTEYLLRNRYGGKRKFNKLAKIAILEIAALQAQRDLDKFEDTVVYPIHK